MSLSKRSFLLVSLSAIAFAFGCSDSDALKEGNKQPLTGKPAVTDPERMSADATEENVDIADAKYNMAIYSGYGSATQNEMCKGPVSMRITSKFGGLMPKGVIKCSISLPVIGKITEMDVDLNKMMPPAGDLEDLSKEQLRKLKGFGQISRLPNPKSKKYAFSPPLPIIIGPLIQNSKEFDGFKFTESVSVNMTTDKGPIKDAGQVAIEVVDIKSGYEAGKYKFADVIQYKRMVRGFDLVPDRGQLMLFSQMEFWYSTQPVAIPKIVISGPLKQIAGLAIGDLMAAIGSLFLGDLTIVLDLTEHTELSK